MGMWSSRSTTERSAGWVPAGDLVLGDVGVAYGCALVAARPVTSERVKGRAGLPSFEDVDLRRVEEVSRHAEALATLRTAGLLYYWHAAGEVRLACIRVHDEMSGDDDHCSVPGIVTSRSGLGVKA